MQSWLLSCGELGALLLPGGGRIPPPTEGRLFPVSFELMSPS